MVEKNNYISKRVSSNDSNTIIFVTKIVRFFGSLRFILIQTILIISWIIYNQIIANSIGITPIDPYPFIFLNSLLSLEAAYLAPLILLSQNYKSDVDTIRDNADFEADLKSEKMIEQILEDLKQIKSKI